VPERRLIEERTPGAFTCWQMGGAGAVGGQVMTGLATLSRLRARFPGKLAAWPFEPLDRPVALLEIWPGLIETAVKAAAQPGEIRDAAQVRLLTGALAEIQARGQLQSLIEDVPDEARKTEGWILGVGHASTLSAAAQPDLVAPRLKDNCFALPPGVDWTPVETALARLKAALAPVVARERIPVFEANGRRLSVPPVAQRSNPPAPNSAVDGYGLAAASAEGPGPHLLPVLSGRAAAGAPLGRAVPYGRAVQVLTGAVLPDGVDTIVLNEDIEAGDGTVAFHGPLKPGANTRRAGEDVREGQELFSAGHRLRPPDLALLAATGLEHVDVFRQLRVGVLSTGDEIVPPGRARKPEHTHDANRPMLLSLAAAWGHAPVDLGHVRDDRDALRDRFDSAEADVILTTGGASAGAEDHVSALLREEGHLTAWRIALKPGRPLALAQWDGTPVFGLPGNPVAAFKYNANRRDKKVAWPTPSQRHRIRRNRPQKSQTS
ncbi:MAG: molybdopterin-binding protein, partial [Planctomycetota bacterium]